MKDNSSRTNQQIVFIGIDWANDVHAVHFIYEGQHAFEDLPQDPAAIEQAVQAWRIRYDGATILVAIEQSRGPLINALLKYDDITIVPINPAALACYRKAFAHGGGKNDPSDAQLLAKYLQHYHQDLRPLRKDDPLTRELAHLAEDRRRFVDERTALCNELKAVLKSYFPVVLKLKAAKIYAEFVIQFLLKYATLTQAQKAGSKRLRNFFYGVKAQAKADHRVKTIMEATPITEDEVVLRTSARRVTTLCKMIQALNQQIRIYDDELQSLVRTHTDYEIVASLPGSAHNTQCRMIAALGDDRTRYPNASAIQCASGIAPITTQSGKSKFVSSRWACSKFMKQTFHEYAGLSIRYSRWARAYYEDQVGKGKSKQAARRALAFKWIRIIHRCWKDRVPYDEQKYIQRLRVTGSPLANLIKEG